MHKNQTEGIPVILVVAGKKINYIPYVVSNLSLHFEFKLFYVICPAKDVDRALSYASGINEKVVVINEELIVPELNLSKVKKHLKLTLSKTPEYQLAGWYFQQFLKMGFSKYATNHEYYLIWDSDTLLTRPIFFFDGDKILLTQGNEFHGEYFFTIKHLFKEINLQSVSHISQHLMVRTADMIELIDSLQSLDQNWWQKILSSLNGKTPFQFSEYETYANYCISKKPDLYRSIKRDWFRYGRSYFNCDIPDANVNSLAGQYDFIAFEDWDQGLLKRARARFLVLKKIIAKWVVA